MTGDRRGGSLTAPTAYRSPEVVMRIQKILPFKLIRYLAVSSIVLLLTACAGFAQTGPTNYALLVGAGVLCDLGDSSACPAVVKSSDGSSYELTGVGMLDAQEKSVTATGTFVHKSPEGNTLESGIWIAKELVSFEFYGLAPGALRRGGMAMGQSPFGPLRCPSPAAGWEGCTWRARPCRREVWPCCAFACCPCRASQESPRCK